MASISSRMISIMIGMTTSMIMMTGTTTTTETAINTTYRPAL